MARFSKKNRMIEQATAKYQVGVYVRLSVEDLRKKENQSIEIQKDIVLNFLEKMPDAKLVRIYQDVNYSGTNFKRPEFEQMINDAKMRKINCIIVKDLSRFGRNFIESGQYMEYVFPFLGVRFIAIYDNYDSFDLKSSNGMILPIKNLMNEVYAKDISKKVKSQYVIKREKGDFCGAFAPYGYIKQGNSLVVDEKVSETVRQIFEMYILGYGDFYIAKILNTTDNLPPKAYRLKSISEQNCGTTWHKSVITRILTNPLYTGNMVSGRFVRSIIYDANQKTTDNVVKHTNTHEPIISQEIFDQAQRIREEKRAKYELSLVHDNKQIKSENIFKGIVYCADCGRIMSRHKTNSKDIKYHYLCQNYEMLGNEICSRKYYPEEKLEQIVSNEIRIQLKELLNLRRLYNSKVKTTTKDNQNLFKLQKKLKEKQQNLNNLYEKYIDKIINDYEYTSLKITFEQDIRNLKNEIDEYFAKVNQDNKYAQNNWYKAEYKGKRKLTREMIISLIDKISIGDNVEISFKYIDEFEVLKNDVDKK